MMDINQEKIKFGGIAGGVTWVLVFGLCLYLLPGNAIDADVNLFGISILFVLYLICFVLMARKSKLLQNNVIGLVVLFAQLIIVYMIMWQVSFGFLQILSIIWAAMLPHFFSLTISVFITFIVVSLSAMLQGFHWNNESYLFQGVLYFTFHLFSLLMMQQVRIAELANLESQQLNKELQATQLLLAEASKQNERTRIARDLHDLLGHHLTALIINLQVTSRISEGEAKVKIEKCHSLAKLLLSDVREAVTTLRDNHHLDINKMIELMIDNVPNLNVITEIDATLKLDDLSLTKGLLSCIQESITNSLRHSGASNFWIMMKLVEYSVELELFDDGNVKGKLIEGNGIKGMKERIESLNGNLSIDKINQALKIVILVPLTQK